MGSALIPEVEKHSALGRSDLEVCAGRRHWVFEFKFASKKNEVSTLLKAGAQQVRSRRYGEGIESEDLQRAVLVFCAETRRFEAWEAV